MRRTKLPSARRMARLIKTLAVAYDLQLDVEGSYLRVVNKKTCFCLTVEVVGKNQIEVTKGFWNETPTEKNSLTIQTRVVYFLDGNKKWIPIRAQLHNPLNGQVGAFRIFAEVNPEGNALEMIAQEAEEQIRTTVRIVENRAFLYRYRFFEE